MKKLPQLQPRERPIANRPELPRQGVTACPLCHQPIRSTAEVCLHCRAERHFGPVMLETAIYSLAGLVLAPALSMLIIPLSLWSILIALLGFMLGFVFSHYRFNIERWIRTKAQNHLPSTSPPPEPSKNHHPTDGQTGADRQHTPDNNSR